MSTDDDDIPEAQLLTLPETALPQGGLARLWAMRSNLGHERNFEEFLKELTGASSRHIMIAAEDDPAEREKRDERHRREVQARDQEIRDLIGRQDRLLAQIEARQDEIDRRRKEIEDNSLRLRDGRHVYVDGNRYLDGEGRALTGPDEAEAARQHEFNPHASTWAEKQKNDRQDEEARRLKEKILEDREQGISPEEAANRLTLEEREFAQLAREQASQAPVDFGGADYMSDYGVPSTVPAFTQAARIDTRETLRKPGDDEAGETKKSPQPQGQGAPKL